MKELSIEQKAKLYDEAYKKVAIKFGSNVADEIFPELKESEDERIRLKFINLVKMSNEVGGFALHKWEADEMLAWLEKQGEQKPAIEMKTPEESLGIDSDTYNKIVEECVYGEQKPAWSEEDDEHLERILKELESQYQKLINRPYLSKIESDYNWLKSIKDRCTWKPSDEQMNELRKYTDSVVLRNLYYNLKKLKG